MSAGIGAPPVSHFPRPGCDHAESIAGGGASGRGAMNTRSPSTSSTSGIAIVSRLPSCHRRSRSHSAAARPPRSTRRGIASPDNCGRMNRSGLTTRPSPSSTASARADGLGGAARLAASLISSSSMHSGDGSSAASPRVSKRSSTNFRLAGLLARSSFSMKSTSPSSPPARTVTVATEPFPTASACMESFIGSLSSGCGSQGSNELSNRLSSRRGLPALSSAGSTCRAAALSHPVPLAHREPAPPSRGAHRDKYPHCRGIREPREQHPPTAADSLRCTSRRGGRGSPPRP